MANEHIVIIDNSLSLSKYDLEKICNNTKIISLDIESHSQLDELKIIHETIDTYLTIDDRKFINTNSVKISLEWHKNLKLLKFDGLNLGTVIEQDVFYYFLEKLKFFFGLLRLLDNESSKVISGSSYVISILKFLDDSKIFKQILSLNYDLNSNLDKISIPLHILGHSKNISFSYEKILKIIKGVEYFSNKFFNLKLDLTKSQKLSSVLFLDLNPTSYENILYFLHENKKQIIFLNEIGTMSWKKSQINILKKTDSKIFQWKDLKTKKTDSQISKNQTNIQSKINEIFSNENFEIFLKIEGYSFWQIIKDEFIIFCMSRFFKSLELLELSKDFLTKINVESIMVLYNTALENKVVLHVAEQMKIPCFKLQHGLDVTGYLSKRLFPIRYPLSTNLRHLFWNENIQKYHFQLGLNQNNGLVVGSPRYDNLFQIKSKNKSGTILLLSTYLQNISSVNGYDSNFLDLHKETFLKICKIINSINGKKPIIKLHPSMKPQYSVKSLLNEFNLNIPIYRTQNIMDLLANSEVVISLDHSTALLESMILKKPTITYMIDSSWYEDDSIITSGATLAVNSIENFEESLNKILFNSNFRNQLIQRGTNYVENNLVNKGNSSLHVGKLLISGS